MMRIAILIYPVLALIAAAAGQSNNDPDPYSMNVVKVALAMRSGGRIVVRSSTQKQLTRLGDGVSIALLKILDASDLGDPQRVHECLPIIRDSFAEPQFISVEADKKPKVTLFLLAYLRQSISDSQVQQEIQQTMEFVKEKSGS